MIVSRPGEDERGPGVLPALADPRRDPARRPQAGEQPEEREKLADGPAQQAPHGEQDHEQNDQPVECREASDPVQLGLALLLATRQVLPPGGVQFALAPLAGQPLNDKTQHEHALGGQPEENPGISEGLDELAVNG